MKKITRREMLKGVSVGLVGAVFAAPSLLNAVEKIGVEDPPLVARLTYDVFPEPEHREGRESLSIHGNCFYSGTVKEFDWVIPAPQNGWRILPSSFKITKTVTGKRKADRVDSPVFQNDGSVKIHIYVKPKPGKHVTLYVTANYDIVPITSTELDLKTESVKFEDGKATLRLPDDKNGRTVRGISVEMIRSSGKKERINVFNVNGDYVQQNGLMVKISKDKKTFYIEHK